MLFCIALTAAGLAYTMFTHPDPYFPGDPPVADTLVEIYIVATALYLVGLGLSVQLSLWMRRGRALIVATIIACIISTMAMLPALTRVAGRQFGDWAELKRLLSENQRHALVLTRRSGGRLSEAEYELAKTWFIEHPIMFRFSETEKIVKIRMMTPLPPYVGVDFGDGRNAIFNVHTMICDYAD